MLTLALTRTAEYALRAMTALALKENKSPVSAGDLAAETGIPVHYLNKIMRRLVGAEFVISSRGHGGGFKLGKPASRISYMDVLQVAGYDAEAKRCVFGWGECRSDRPCPMHESWSGLNENFIAWARKTNLATLKKSRKAA